VAGVPVEQAGAAQPPTQPAEAQFASGCGRGSESVRCQSFSSVESAFEFVLEKQPRLLAIGEAHAQKGTENVPSATRRFAESMLPMLKGRASQLLIELWVANGNCGQVERKVSKQQQAVTQNQAATNQNEYLWLGHRAKALGMTPYALTPSCEEYQSIATAGPQDVDRMLEMIARASAKRLLTWLETSNDERSPELIVAYGGALHNDLAPRRGREHWSFGPELARKTGGAYVELDLIVPEYVKAEPSWQSFPWYASYASAAHSKQTLLYSTNDQSFTLIFAKTPAAPVLPSNAATPVVEPP
jgi:hypothetical protein